MTSWVVYGDMAYRSSLIPVAGDAMAVLECDCSLAVEFIVEDSSPVAKHGIEDESALGHLAVLHIPSEHPSIAEFDL